ncbi:MAG: LuxR C-terminal-related transcriptional regulator [Anaerolineales bacterium]
MQGKEIATTLIQAKLHRPPLPTDLVPRPRLTELIDSHRLPPLILISAPAGYGKSTLAKCLVEALDLPAGWLSLDEHDNDLGGFLQYFLAAVQSIFPEALQETQASLAARPQPALYAVTRILINELDRIEQPYILVLDDYHVIESQPIHDLLNEVLLHPPRNLHLVISTRLDPPLSLITLRASSRVIEFRTQDLRFNLDETRILFHTMLGENLDQAAIDEVDSRAEGWVTGLRLAALVMRHRIGRDSFEGELSLQNPYVTEYLVSEILAKQAASLSDCMLRTSILDRFCAELCEAICFEDGETSNRGDFNGFSFTEWLRNSNLFVIPLDDRGKWFRYHHLFRDFLQQELAQRSTPDGIARLHTAAGGWYARNGWFEEALYHLLAAKDTNKAIQLVAQRRYSMMNTTQWPRLERWLNLFSSEIVEKSPELWMLKTWLVYQRGQFAELPALIGHLDAIYENEPNQAAVSDLAGEISSLRALIAYYQGNADQAVSMAQDALNSLPPDLWIARVLARIYLSGSYLLRGDENQAYRAYYDAFKEEQLQDKQFKATLLMAACSFYWITADLKSMAQAAKQCIALCQETGQQQILGFGSYQLGRVRYHQDRLPAAEQLFASVVSRPYLNYGIPYANSACGLALTYQALGREAKAQQVSEDAIAFLLETGNTTQLPIALALQAELALMQGRVDLASQWADKFDPVPQFSPTPWFLSPHLTLVKVWLAQNTFSSLESAADLLDQLERYQADIHNRRFLIETLALKALLLQTKGEQSAALVKLQEALRLAQPGGFVRLFVDLGQELENLLNELEAPVDLQPYVELIKTALSRPKQGAISPNQDELFEPLTYRELEVLALLAERKTNKEIAFQLNITPGTVRQHTHNLYQKLEVSNRREAVTKAQEFSIL